MPTKTFNNISENQFESYKSKLIEMGCDITEQTVTLTKPVKIVFGYKYGNGQLTLTIIEKPWIVSESKIWTEMDKHLAA